MPLSRTEALGRALFYHYFPRLRQTHNLRPDWLTWPVTGNRLELDIYFPEIRVAVEIDGIQHGRPIKGLQRDFAAFERQQARDLWKADQCRSLGDTLYKLTVFDLTQARFEVFIKRFAASHQLTVDRYVDPPVGIYREAERLSRSKFRAKRQAYRKPGLIPLIQRFIARHRRSN